MCRCLLFIIVIVLAVSCSEKKEKVLIFSKTEGFRHGSIEEGKRVLRSILEEELIEVDTTEDASFFNEELLKTYSAVVFLNTTGDVLDSEQQADFERYIQAGGGFVGIHAATDTEYDWPWYNGLVGAYFNGHPAIQDAKLICSHGDHSFCDHVDGDWSISDEWYNFRSINPDIEVIMEIDESSYKGGTNGDFHPMVWRHDYDGGRAFYTGLGHKNETFSNPVFQQQIIEGIRYAIGDNRLDYSKATTSRVPEENRFTKTVLDFNLDEPMELDELGDRGIVFIERRGAVKLFEYETEKTIALDTIDVFYANEDGLLGVAVDPDFQKNQWMYFFYSPNVPESIQYVSRFTLEDDQLVDEKVLLEIPLIRKCCHSGGSLEFGNDGLLYVGVGDNTNPFESSGFAPIDERPGRQLWDAQRSASNTNDLRGKILRIKPEADGTYSIPDGNLFPVGEEKTRPEIYTMGLRNPFRFSIDSKTNYLYWGDVGPDAGARDSTRGPSGMGEFNQAKVAGYYGWPYSRGNNQMYIDYNFTTKTSSSPFDPNKIINDSPNNTGKRMLPPIQESLIWYSYKESKEFPWLGDGGINPMSGPIYHIEDYQKSESSFPDYFDNKWFVYEWMRDWIYVVELDEDYNYVQADPFMPSTEFSHPMDMIFTKEGHLYILEYGQKWNSRNLDARLSKITYNPGNREPVARVTSDKQVGANPLTVQFSADDSYDYDKDDLKYVWKFEAEEITTISPYQEYTFQNPGIYDVMLKVGDGKGKSSTAFQKIMVGNEPPTMEIQLADDNRTYWTNREVEYQIEVTDAEDGKTTDSSFDASKVKVTFNYIPEGEDMILASMGHQQNAVPRGLQLIQESDCKACHAANVKVAGPSYVSIAERYDQTDKQKLIYSIIQGSQGIWGETMMAAHPQLKVEEVGEIVDYILSLDPDKTINEKQLPLSGKVRFDKHGRGDQNGKYVLMASYLDDGHPEVEGSQLSAVEEIVFIPPKIELEDAIDLDKSLGLWSSQGRRVVGSIKAGKNIQLPVVSFENLESVSIGAVFGTGYPYYGVVEIRKGSVEGELVGSGTIEYYDKDKEAFKEFDIPISTTTGVDNMFLVFTNQKDPDQFVMNGDWIRLDYKE